MTQFLISALLALVVLQAPPANPPAPAQHLPATGTLEGIVVRNGTNEPVSGAQITVTRVTTPGQTPALPVAGARGANPAGAAAAVPAVRSGSDGKFQINDLPPGSYRLSAARNGYAKLEYGQRSFRTPGAVISLQPGQSMKDVVFKMVSAGTISGRVTDPAAEPLAGITVQLLRSVYDAQGRKALQPSVNVRTNDLGEYRLYWVTPGTYYLNATASGSYFQNLMQSTMSSAVNNAQAQGTNGNPSPAQTMESILGINTNEVVEPGFATTFYPNTADSSRAAPVEVQPGAELRAMDIALVRQPSYRVRGRVFDARTGQTPQTAIVQLASRVNFGATAPKPMTSYDAATGNYEFTEVPAGEYLVVALVPAITTGGAPSIGVASANVDVSSANVDGVVLSIRQGASISGQVNVEGGQSPADVPGFDRMRVRLIPSSDLVLNPGMPTALRPDGSFKLDNVASGDFRVAMAGLPANYYVKAASFGGSDALNEAAAISPSSSGAIDVLISPNAGQIAGTLVDRDQKPVPATQVVLIPDRQRDHRDFYKTALSDAAGRFTFQGIPPGAYKLFAWEDIDAFAYYDTEVLRRFEQGGAPVNVSESSKITQEVKIIPAGR